MAGASQASQRANRIAKYCASTSVVISIGSFLVDFLPHTFFVDKYKKYLHAQKFGEEIPLDENVKSLFDSVLDDLKLSDEEKKKFEPFTVGGFEVHHAGIPSGRCHSIIGLPTNFAYKSVHSIEATEIRIGLDREYINIYHPAAENLMESLVFSDKAKKFAIAREILMTQQNVPIYRAIESPVIFLGSVFMAEFARVKLNLSQKPIPLTILTFGVSGIMGIMMWFQLRDFTNTYFEKQVDKALAELGEDYIEGGKEYYDKILKKNIALRTLLGQYGNKLFKTDGDEVISIRQKSTPISHRRKFFEDYKFTDTAEQAL